MSREEKMRELIQQEQELMREIYGFDKGVAHERERIIKLLDQRHDATWPDKTHNASGLCEACNLIQLIKGEQK